MPTSGTVSSQTTPTRGTPSSTISSKGQVTIPIEVRHRLGLKEGDRVEFVFEDGRTILRPMRTEGNPISRLCRDSSCFFVSRRDQRLAS